MTFEDKLFKLKLLYIFIIDSLKAWKEFIWDVELDELYCCNGRECGCQGITNRQLIMWQNNMLPPKPIVGNFERESFVFVKDGQE